MPITKGHKIGCMEAVTGAEKIKTPTDWRCVNCGSIRHTSAKEIKWIVGRDGIGTGCGPCTKKVKAEVHKRAAAERRSTGFRLGLGKSRSARLSMGNCHHKKCLICVDPGNVEIWRCPECDVTAVPRWEPTRVGSHRGTAADSTRTNNPPVSITRCEFSKGSDIPDDNKTEV